MDFPPIRDPSSSSSFQKEVFTFFKNKFVSSRTEKSDLPLFPYQNLFASLFQVYPRFLLLAEPGTGKTITFIEACERAKRSGTVKNVVIFESSQTLLNNVVREIYKVISTTGVPFKETKSFIKNFKKEISSFYKITTYKKFYNKHSQRSIQELRNDFFSTIFVCDEVHKFIGTLNLGTKSAKDIAKKELDFFYFLFEKVLLGSHKLILVSATPLTTEVEQIFPYIRLLGIKHPSIPLKEGEKVNLSSLRKDISQIFNGYTSYIKSFLNPSVTVREICCIPTKLKNILNTISTPGLCVNYKLYFSEMKDKQLSTYIYYDTPSRRGEYGGSNLIQASSFVFPDESIGGKVSTSSIEEDEELIFSSSISKIEKGLEKYVVDTSKKYDLPGSYEFKKPFKDDLRELSCKFSSIIDIECKNINTPGTSFIYTGNMKNGGGSIILSLILEKYGGFTNYRKSKRLSNKTYVLINTEMSNEEKDTILEIFNSKENVTGNKIKLIIGTSQLREGISFFHCVRVHILNRAWTYAEDLQSTYRALRATSHDELYRYYKEKLGIRNPNITVDIYKHAAFGFEGKKLLSNDLHIEETNIKRQNCLDKVINGLKDAAIDKLFFEKEISQIVDKKIKEEKKEKVTNKFFIKDSFFFILNHFFPLKKTNPILYYQNCLIENQMNNNKYILKEKVSRSEIRIFNSFLLKNSLEIYGKFQQNFNNRARLVRFKDTSTVSLRETSKNFHYLFFDFLKKNNFNKDLFENINKFSSFQQQKFLSKVSIDSLIEKFYIQNKGKIKIFGTLETETGEFKIIDRTKKVSNKGKSCLSYDKKELHLIYKKFSQKKLKEIQSKTFYCEELQKLFNKQKILIKF